MIFGKMTLDKFVEELKAAWGDNLVSLVLYGSAAAGDFVEKKSDYNTLAVLRDDSAGALRKAVPVVRRWAKSGHPAPVLFTSAKLAVSCDVFPLEFQDIRDKGRILAGEDVLGALDIERGDARRQLEHELSGKIQSLRRALLSGADPANLRQGSLPAFLVLFRHVLRLLGEPAPASKSAALEPLCRRLSLNRSAFEGDDFDAYLAALDKVAAAVNAMK
jgi:predicted nucleotidyltransferase